MAVQKTEIRMARPFNLKEKAVKFNNGRTMPVLGLGTYSLHGQTCIRAVRSALDCGVRLRCMATNAKLAWRCVML